MKLISGRPVIAAPQTIPSASVSGATHVPCAGGHRHGTLYGTSDTDNFSRIDSNTVTAWCLLNLWRIQPDTLVRTGWGHLEAPV